MALISFAVTAKLICAFVFAFADCWFSHVAAHMVIMTDINLIGAGINVLLIISTHKIKIHMNAIT